jgi:hypothetical protein
MGNSLESVRFYTKGDHRLCQLAIANDFISIPVVTMATLVFPERIWGPGFKIKVKNSKGVRLTDVFVALEKEFDYVYLLWLYLMSRDSRSNVPVYTQDYGIIKKGEALGDHRYPWSNLCWLPHSQPPLYHTDTTKGSRKWLELDSVSRRRYGWVPKRSMTAVRYVGAFVFLSCDPRSFPCIGATSLFLVSCNNQLFA